MKIKLICGFIIFRQYKTVCELFVTVLEMDDPISSLSKLQAVADDLYEKAGEHVEEEESQITLAKYDYLLSDEVATIIDQVLEENPLPFKLQDFQLLALHALGSLKNVVLVSPTGTGKMIIAYLAIPGKPLN